MAAKGIKIGTFGMLRGAIIIMRASSFAYKYKLTPHQKKTPSGL